ncbi:mRNA cap guanine-N7 methyltransferase isoform X2 [Daphnia magna]|uniref:mRNA cap guanine-N7 methyltransferase isoform X2 n=1 Tax=Daphnia magna TaxID=35525 RepID=UPI001E1BD37B|nr:mRNA cap guanine-N7 methyltransferase isoform X2 [Daphnia magna]
MKSVKEKLPLEVYSELIHQPEGDTMDASMNTQQIHNAQKSAQKAEHLSLDTLCNLNELRSETHFVSDIHLAPSLLVICFKTNTIEEFKHLFHREDLFTPSLSYDSSTFQMDDYNLSILTYRQTEFEDLPVTPLMYMIHEKKVEKAHNFFFMRLNELIPELKAVETMIIATENDEAIVNAMQKYIPHVTIFRNWQHALQDINKSLQNLEITDCHEVKEYESDFIRLLDQESCGDYKSILAQMYLKKWNRLHIPEEGISTLSSELLNSFEKSNLEHNDVKSCKLLENTDASEKEVCVGSVVANHYNQLSERGVAERKESRIFHMRNLNNWIKSRIIGNILDRIRKENGPHCRLNVLDLGCGKGGDLLKWERGHVHHVVCADIAETSIEQCKERYAKLKHRSRQVFSAEFIAADCSKENIMERMENCELKLDLVSCQFAFHYSFESLPQAEQMLANVSCNLQPGGYFIGTTTDAYDIMRRLRRDENPENRKFGNSIFSVEFPPETLLDPPPLFGAKYNFHLEEVVDCPEFLVNFPTFEKLASKYGLTLVQKTRFEDFVPQELECGKDLLMRMKALEAYPPYTNQEPVSTDHSDYLHAQEYLNSYSTAEGFRPKIGTLSKAEWEAVSLYLVYIFRKEDLNKDRKRRHSSSSNEEDNTGDKGKRHLLN